MYCPAVFLFVLACQKELQPLLLHVDLPGLLKTEARLVSFFFV